MKWADERTFCSLEEFGRVIGVSLLLTAGVFQTLLQRWGESRVVIMEAPHPTF